MARKKVAAGPRGTRRGGAPAGKSVGPTDLRVLARGAALAALERLAALSQSEDERVALAASQELLNRAFGKTSGTATDEAASARPVIVKIVRFGTACATAAQGGGQP
jgi:hypothetical protein